MIIYINMFQQLIKESKKVFHLITVLNQKTTGSARASDSHLTTENTLVLI